MAFNELLLDLFVNKIKIEHLYLKDGRYYQYGYINSITRDYIFFEEDHRTIEIDCIIAVPIFNISHIVFNKIIYHKEVGKNENRTKKKSVSKTTTNNIQLELKRGVVSSLNGKRGK